MESPSMLATGPAIYEIEPELSARQREYEELCHSQQSTSLPAPELKSYFKSLDSDLTRAAVAGLWLEDGFHARKIQYPASNQLNFIRIYHSTWLFYVFNIVAILQIIGPLLERPWCGDQNIENNNLVEHNMPTRLLFSFVDIIAAIVYSYDLYLQLVVDFKGYRSTWYRRGWVLFRQIALVLLVADIAYFYSKIGANNSPRMIRCIFPFFFISRRRNLRLMVEGLARSAYYTRHIVYLLVSVLFLWGFMGFFLFSRLPEPSGRWSTPTDAVFSVLHGFTSRPINLTFINALFESSNSHLPSLFFVSLTLVIDLLGINFIIANGTREYKLFCAAVLSDRLANRKAAFDSIFDAYSLPVSHLLSSSTNSFNSKQRFIGEDADVMVLRFDDWISIATSLSSDTIIKDSHIAAAHNAKIIFDIEERNLTGDTGTTNADLEITNPSISIDTNAIDTTNKLNSRNSLNHQNSMHGLSDEVRPSVEMNSKVGLTFPLLDSSLEYNHRNFTDKNTCVRQISVTAADDRDWTKSTKNKLKFMINFVILRRVRLANIISCLMHILLIVYLIFLTKDGGLPSWIGVGWFLQTYFILVATAEYLGFGRCGYENQPWEFAAVNVINLVTFILMLCINFDATNSTAFVIFVLAQSFRLFKLVFIINDYSLFRSIFPLLGRCGFIYFAIVYFFSVWAQIFFCSMFDENNIKLSNTDDDSEQWLNYSSILNFQSLPLCLFTLFEMSVLGNWSVTMDALVRSKTASATNIFLFFYTYRLLMTLVIIPVLLAFIMQAFLSSSTSTTQLKSNVELSPEISQVSNIYRDTLSGGLGKIGSSEKTPKEIFKVEVIKSQVSTHFDKHSKSSSVALWSSHGVPSAIRSAASELVHDDSDRIRLLEIMLKDAHAKIATLERTNIHR